MSDYQQNENEYVNHEDIQLERHPDEKPGFFELIYGTLFNPVDTFTKVSHDPPLFKGFIIFMISLLLTSVSRILLPQDIADMPPEIAGIFSQVGPSIAVFGAIITLIFWFIQAGILQVVAELLGGRGTAIGVLTILALSGIPAVLAIPFHVAGYFLSESILGRFLAIAGSLLSFVWWVVILVLGLRQVHGYSTGKAVVTVVAPIITLLLIITVMFIILFAFIGPLINSVQ